MASECDRANRSAWGNREVAKRFAERDGFSSDGEAHVMRRVATVAEGQPILDVGVGGGRTVRFLRSVSEDYVGVDYIEQLVTATRRRYPHVRVEHMDARDLSAFADSTFALVVFSRNGIDGVPRADRSRILIELHRVLRPGGLLAYSTHNLDYRSAARHRWRVDWPQAITHPGAAIRRVARLPSATADFLKLRTLDASGEGWASRASLAYGHAVIWYRVTFPQVVRELRDSGFGTIELYDAAGLSTTVDAGGATWSTRSQEVDTSQWPTLHLVAHRPLTEREV